LRLGKSVDTSSERVFRGFLVCSFVRRELGAARDSGRPRAPRKFAISCRELLSNSVSRNQFYDCFQNMVSKTGFEKRFQESISKLVSKTRSKLPGFTFESHRLGNTFTTDHGNHSCHASPSLRSIFLEVRFCLDWFLGLSSKNRLVIGMSHGF
jgi:hypothetical protein